jgi:hypothetical protein
MILNDRLIINTIEDQTMKVINKVLIENQRDEDLENVDQFQEIDLKDQDQVIEKEDHHHEGILLLRKKFR